MNKILGLIHQRAKPEQSPNYRFSTVEVNSFSSIRADFEVFVDMSNKGNLYVFAKYCRDHKEFIDIKISYGGKFRYVFYIDSKILLMYSQDKELNKLMVIKHRKHFKHKGAL